MDRKFQNIINQLSKSEQEIVEKNKITTLDKLIPLLLKRVPNENSQGLIKALMEALRPSMSNEQDDDFDKLYEQLKLNPKLLFEKKTQETISELIIKRVNSDKKKLIQKTSDITTFMDNMQNELNEAINVSGSSSSAVHEIKDKIISIDNECDKNMLLELKDQLINISTNIEEEMCKVTIKLKDGKEKINELQEKIKHLEIELKRTKSESKTDYLTGILSRRALDEEVDKFEDRFSRDKDNFAIIFFDIDHFKHINDKFGHDAGDIVLSTFAKILEKSTRKTDILARYGGEEFIALVHYKDVKEVVGYVNRVKSIIDGNSFVYKENKIKVAFSAGISFREKFEDYRSALKHADDLLYKAKQNGRNQIVY